MTCFFECLYASRDSNLDVVAARLNESLGLMLEPHDSMYWGDYYLDASRHLNDLRLYLNEDPMYLSDTDSPEERWFEPNYREYTLLLYTYGLHDTVEAFRMRLLNASPNFGFELIQSRKFAAEGG